MCVGFPLELDGLRPHCETVVYANLLHFERADALCVRLCWRRRSFCSLGSAQADWSFANLNHGL